MPKGNDVKFKGAFHEGYLAIQKPSCDETYFIPLDVLQELAEAAK